MSTSPYAIPATALPYSFVQIGDPATQGCTADPQFCLPLSDPGNLIFQVVLDNVPPINSEGTNYYLYAVPVPCDADCSGSYLGSTSYSISGGTVYEDIVSLLPYALIVSEHLQTLSTDTDGNYKCVAYFDTVPSLVTTPTSVGPFVNTFEGRSALATPYDYTVHTVPPTLAKPTLTPANILTTIEVGQCFRLQFIFEYLDTELNIVSRTYIDGCSNCFIRIPENQCYTSVVEYNNSPANTFGFYYDWNIPNVVELPLYLRDPVMENDQKVYTRSDGTIVKLYERKEEIYMLETDLMPYTWHKALDIALSHDTVIIANPNSYSFDPVNTATHFVKKENYEIEYQKAPLSALGKGSCKLSNADAVSLINNNCG